MTTKRFTIEIDDENFAQILDNNIPIGQYNLCNVLNRLYEENKKLKEENNKLHTKIFEMRTNIALERTEISGQTYTGKKNEKEYLDAKEFLDELEKW